MLKMLNVKPSVCINSSQHIEKIKVAYATNKNTQYT